MPSLTLEYSTVVTFKMVLNNVLASLKLSMRRMKAAEKSILPLERKANTITDPGLIVIPQLSDLRSAFDSALSDLSLAASLVAKYQAVLRGIPLDHDSAIIDRFTDSVDSEGEQAVISEFMNAIAGGTGLEYYLCGQDSGSDNIDEWASEEEIFATYRAIGSMWFTEFELGVHRAVWKAEEMAMALAVKVEKMVKDGETVKGKEKSAKKPVKKAKKAKK